jgi:thioredoxin 1
MAELVLTKENFKAEVLQSTKPVLVDFWATWCGPCRMLAPIIEELAKEYEGRVVVGKVNIDEQPELAEVFQIQSIPTVLVFKNGELVTGCVGMRPKADILALLA